MKVHPLHSWDLTPTEAAALQRELTARIDVSRPLGHYTLVAGADVSYNRFSSTIYAGVVVVRMEDLAVVESQGAVCETSFPYIPGFLSFREGPALLEAFAKIESAPDVVIFDGQGIAHPRRLGLACHIGLWLDRPCLGCAKSRLCGRYQEPGRQAGARIKLVDAGEVVGTVVRTKTGTKPLFVSPGHGIDLPGAVQVVLDTCRGYRLPEPTRQAHLHVNALRRAAAG